LENPLIACDYKAKTMANLLQGAKGMTSITTNLMTTLAGNARLVELSKIVNSYQKLMKAKWGEMEATIISANVLATAQTEAIQQAMVQQVPVGKLILSTKVNPSILGRLQVQIGDKFLDLIVGSHTIDQVSQNIV
jgi:F-type H+-transporting ATPase subunit O